MLEFRDLTIEDKEWVTDILRRCDYMSCEYCFGNHFIWNNIYRNRIARIGDYYTILLSGDTAGQESFLFPAGTGSLKPVIETLLEYAEQQDFPFRMHSMPEECVSALETAFPGKFSIQSDRDNADYIYRVEDLVNLAGKKYHGKRNHLARFREKDWSFEPITKDNLDECITMNEEWCRLRDCGQSASLRAESCAVQVSFQYFDRLDFFGGLLRREGRVVAYTIAERLNSETAVVHIEKALPDIQGAYVAINREFAANCCGEYCFLNREEDLGVEGLRKAKLSWNPYKLQQKYTVELK